MKNKVVAWWYYPRDGQGINNGEFKYSGYQKFLPPSSGKNHEWVLVIDDKKSKLAGWE